MNLIKSVDDGDINAVRRLLERGARVSEADEQTGMTALHIACFIDRLDIVRVLIEFHADVNATNNYGCTPLHVACEKSKNRSLPDFLHAQGARPLILTNDGRSILHVAASRGNLSGISFALQFCDVNLRNKDGQTPLHMGVMGFASKAALQLLLDSGADPKIKDKWNRSAKDYAVRMGKGQDVIDLLSRNA